MNPAAWELADREPEDEDVVGSNQSALVNLHFFRSALRRRRRLWRGLMLTGLLLAGLYLVAVPAPHKAEVTLVMAHDPATDSTTAMDTDVSLATTRAVAADAIADLKLTITPAAMLRRVTVTAVSSDILQIEYTGTTDATALAGLQAYTKSFLDFRTQQLEDQNNATNQGVNDLIKSKNSDIAQWTAREQQLTQSGVTASDPELATLVSEISQTSAQVSNLNDQVAQANSLTTGLVAASGVIDKVALETTSSKRRPVLVLASGLIGGTAIGIGLVLLMSILSDKLRRRVEVATAIEAPVTVSVGHLTPVRSFLRAIPPWRGRAARREADLERFAHGLIRALPGGDRGGWLAVGCVDNADEVRHGVAAAARELERRGRRVRLMDLTDSGGLGDAVGAVMSPDSVRLPSVSRPRGIPALLEDARDIHTLGHETGGIPGLNADDLFITIADLDPTVGADHLTKWTERVVVVVTAGLSRAERVRTAADTVRAAGLELQAGLMVGTEPWDDSIGRPLVLRPKPEEDGPAWH